MILKFCQKCRKDQIAISLVTLNSLTVKRLFFDFYLITTFFDQTPISSVTLNSLVVKRLSDRDVRCNSPFQSAMKTQRSTIFSQLFRLNRQPNMKSYVFFQIINFAAFIEDYAESSPLLMEKCCPYLIAMFDMFQVLAPAIPKRLSSRD